MKYLTATLPFALLFAGVALPVLAVASVSDIGQPALATPTTRAILLNIHESNDSQKMIKVAPGETVRFVLTNQSAYLHEFNIGRSASHLQHQRAMAALLKDGTLTPTGLSQKVVRHERPGVGDSNPPGTPEVIKAQHVDSNAVLIEPGETKEFAWTFPGSGELSFACTLPGHLQAGERGAFTFR